MEQFDSNCGYFTVISSSVLETGQASIETVPHYIEVIPSNTEMQSTNIEGNSGVGSINTNRAIENIYNIEFELSNIGTRPDVINIENSGTSEGMITECEGNDNYDNLQVALPMYKNAREMIKFTTMSVIVIITICCGIYYIAVEDILSHKVDFGISEINSTSFEIQTTAGITTAKIRVLNKELTVTNGYNNKGEWYAYMPVMCDYGSYASGLQLQVEQDGGTWHDDSGVTDLWLHCSALKSQPNTSKDHKVKLFVTRIMAYGSSWTKTIKCKENHYVVAFQLRTDAHSWAMDKAGVTNMDIMCRGPGLYGSGYEIIEGNGLANWGNYGGFSEECSNGSAVCAFTLRYQQSKLKSIIDRVGVTNVKLMCC